MILKTLKFILLLPYKIIGIILATLFIIRYGSIKKADLKIKNWRGRLTEAIKANKIKRDETK